MANTNKRIGVDFISAIDDYYSDIKISRQKIVSDNGLVVLLIL